MKKVTYPYSPELKTPGNTAAVDYDDPKMAASLLKIGGFIQKMVRAYHPKNNVSLRQLTYISYDSTPVNFYLFEPDGCATETLPCIIYYHGGGFMFPIQPVMMKVANYYAKHLHCRVVLPEFRLSLTNSCQDILEDCYGMYQHLYAHASDLHVDPSRIIVYGDSAGGALAAGVTHMARDRHKSKATGLMLIYPVIDNHSERYDSITQYPEAVWPANANRSMWRRMFERGTFDMERYAAPINNKDFSGLPLTYIEPQEVDILRDEAIAYSIKLKAAGCLLDLNVIPGSYHGMESDWKSPLTQRLLAHRCEVMKTMLDMPGKK